MMAKHKLTSHVIAQLKNSKVFIISAIAGRLDFCIISVDSVTGNLWFRDLLHIDVFETEELALAHILNQESFAAFVFKKTYAAILGYLVYEGEGHFLMVDQTRDVQLPGAHIARNIENAEWIHFDLSFSIADSHVEHLSSLEHMPIAGAHYYSDTVDLCSHFLTSSSTMQWDSVFCWNRWICQPFIKAGLPQFCALMLQGDIDGHSHVPENSVGAYSCTVLLMRRHTGNIGTVFNSVGLNAKGGLANETEYELIAWSPQCNIHSTETVLKSDSYIWQSFIWRQGSLPIIYKETILEAGSSSETGVEGILTDSTWTVYV